MDLIENPVTTSEPNAIDQQEWEIAFQVLGEQLSSHDGCISTKALIQELKKKGVESPNPLVLALRFFDRGSSHERGIPTPSFEFGHIGRSFYSKDRFDQEQRKQERATAEEAEDASREVSTSSPEEITVSRTNRQDEARLITYVKSALEGLYESDFGPPENTEFVFDVHSARKGSNFENVDLIAVHWRSPDFCDLIAVEVKLEFTAHAVQQALNYTRFAHRAWVAVVVASDSRTELLQLYPTLFEYAISHGLGILACRRRQGRSYEVLPVHWPLRNLPDPLEERGFIERYRDELERAEAVEPEQKRMRPRFR